MAISQIRSSRFVKLASFRNSIGRRLWLSTHFSPEEINDELLDEILAAREDPSISREELCVDHIRKLCASGDLHSAARIPRILIGKQIFLGSRVYDCLLEAADQKNDIDMLSQVFKDLLVTCGSIRLNSYLIIARAFGQHNDPAMLLNFVGEICEMGLARTDIILNRIVYALAKCGHVDSALLVFDYMKSSRHKPDLYTYNTVFDILGRLGRVDQMLGEFDGMKIVDLVPDVVTYNTILSSLRKMGRFDLCLVYFQEMKERGVHPDVMTFKPLIETLGRSGKVEEALRLFDDMNRMGIRPSVYIYRALIFSLKKMGKMDLAARFTAEMNKLLTNSVVPRDYRYRDR